MADNFDKFRPDWTVGTLTLTGGSTAFTATDAELILAAIREGDAIITPSGFFLPIETLAEDGLTGTLSNPAPAAATGTFDTRIRYQSDNSRFTGALLALTRQLTGGNLQSFGNLLGLQDLMPIFLGPGSIGLINKSEVGIQDPNESLAELAALALAANKILNTDASGNLTQSDITAAALVLLKLAGAAAENKLPYFDGANSSALTTFTGFARSMLDDTDGAAVWNTLGFSKSTNGANRALWANFPDGLKIRMASLGTTTDAAGNMGPPEGLVFPAPFTADYSYIIVAISGDANFPLTFHFRPDQSGSTAPNMSVRNLNGSLWASAPVRINYIAIGW